MTSSTTWTCSACGQNYGVDDKICPGCGVDILDPPIHELRGSQALCVVSGIFGIIIGFYLLVVNPTVGGDVVNSQKLYVGQTAAICGTILLAAGVRPHLAPRV
jgi:hypothetical protein